MSVTSSVSTGQDWYPDASLLRRIKTAYRSSISKYRQTEGSMWAAIAERHRNVHDALLSDDDKALADLLANPSRNEMFYGMDGLIAHRVKALQESDVLRHQTLETIKTYFVELAETVGATRAWYFKARPDRIDLTVERVEEIIEGIDKIVGARLAYPNPFENEFGISTSRGIIVMRTPMAIYLAHRLQTIVGLVNGGKILEIGPGNGRLVFYANALGLTDYTTVDLPMGIVCQACFLAATLGPDKIWMAGDDPALQRGRVRLLPPFALEAEDFDIVVNADSLTEMAPEDATEYLRYAARHSKALISINHEFNTHTVSELAQMAGIATLPIRSLSTIRRGYVEELFLWHSSHANINVNPRGFATNTS
jgi:hypothetical protein